MNKALVRLGHLYFFILFIGSIVFFRERTLYMDCAYQCFNLINSEWFFVASKRYSVVIPELIPLLCVWVKAPLWLILMAFSLSYTLLYYIIFLISSYTFRTSNIILAIMLVLSGFSVQSYFHIVTETHQGLMYAVLLFAWIGYYNQFSSARLLLFYFITALILIMAFFAHPVTLFPILFIIGFYFLAEWNRPDIKRTTVSKKYVPLLAVILLVYLWRVIITPANSYDGQFYWQLFASFSKPFFKFFPLLYVMYHIKFYLLQPIIFMTLLRWYWLKNGKVLFFYVLVSTLLFSFILQLAFGNGDSDVMMEKNIMPLALFLGFPLCYYLTSYATHKQKKIAVLLVLLSVLNSFAYEISYSSVLNKRLTFYSRLCLLADKENHHKILIPDYCAPHKSINWALCPEMLLYSSLDKRNCATAAYVRDSNVGNLCDSNLLLFVPFWENCNNGLLNPTYFNLPRQKYVNVQCDGRPGHFNLQQH